MHSKRDYRYDLPPEQIAQLPADRRDGSRLLRVGRGERSEHRFADLAGLLGEGSVLVVNDSKVLAARLHARKDTGGAVELLLVEPTAEPGCWRAMARSSKPLRDGARLALCRRGADPAPGAPVVVIRGDRDADGTLVVELPGDAEPLLSELGEVPLPPYIERPAGSTEADRERYQTVYARAPGAVAAPTAGLHFTEALLGQLEGRGIAVARLTLHVGLGTFAPVRGDDLGEHEMHTERFSIPAPTAELVNRARAEGRPVIAVGTTSVRALEASWLRHGRVAAGDDRTDLFIVPGFRFQVVDRLITNFHLPESTLLALVCAFGGHRTVMDAYRHAVGAGYRFYSYGDAMLVDRDDEGPR